MKWSSRAILKELSRRTRRQSLNDVQYNIYWRGPTCTIGQGHEIVEKTKGLSIAQQNEKTKGLSIAQQNYFLDWSASGSGANTRYFSRRSNPVAPGSYCYRLNFGFARRRLWSRFPRDRRLFHFLDRFKSVDVEVVAIVKNDVVRIARRRYWFDI